MSLLCIRQAVASAVSIQTGLTLDPNGVCCIEIDKLFLVSCV
jgi:hypothetical protein